MKPNIVLDSGSYTRAWIDRDFYIGALRPEVDFIQSHAVSDIIFEDKVSRYGFNLGVLAAFSAFRHSSLTKKIQITDMETMQLFDRSLQVTADYYSTLAVSEIDEESAQVFSNLTYSLNPNLKSIHEVDIMKTHGQTSRIGLGLTSGLLLATTDTISSVIYRWKLRELDLPDIIEVKDEQ